MTAILLVSCSFSGKTAQMLTLVCIQKMVLLASNTLRSRASHTLIVVQNVSLMEQWQKEIAKCFKPGSLTSLLYHGIAFYIYLLYFYFYFYYFYYYYFILLLFFSRLMQLTLILAISILFLIHG
jgi:hypothetical protein